MNPASDIEKVIAPELALHRLVRAGAEAIVVLEGRGTVLLFSTKSRPRSWRRAAAFSVLTLALTSAQLAARMRSAFAQAAPNWALNRTHCGVPPFGLQKP